MLLSMFNSIEQELKECICLATGRRLENILNSMICPAVHCESVLKKLMKNYSTDSAE